MSVFHKLFRFRNPTRNWVREPSRTLSLNLDSNSLSGVPLGSNFNHLKFLGPAQRSKTNPELWEFSSLGIAVESQAERIVGLFVVPTPDEHFAVAPYTGVVAIAGRRVSIPWISGEQNVIRLFGEPARRDEDNEETILFYKMPGAERQIELTPEGRIKTIAIFSYT